MLTGLCTNAVPAAESVPGHWRLSRRLATPHLPQGAPTSPALANLAAFALDRRLTGLAAAIGATLHPLRRRSRALQRPRTCARRSPRSPRSPAPRASASTRAKTRVMGRGRRQTVTGIVVNAHPNVPRAEYDTLEGDPPPRRARRPGADLDPTVLLGRIAWVESLNPTRGAKLRDGLRRDHLGAP